MKKDDFDLLAQNILNDCYDMLLKKEEEYSEKADRLSAFKLNFMQSEGIKLNPTEVLWGMMVKHINSIYTLIKNNDLNNPLWYEKIVDNICYLVLLWALIDEGKIRK